MRAFSLVELSIVLVILGLLTGGVLTGRSLIRAAEMRSVTTDLERTLIAINTFHDRYFALPGDFEQATAFWGAQSGAADCTNRTGAASLDSGVCDGNGNGVIRHAEAGKAAENFQFWRHLDHAGLVAGSHTGITGDAHYAHVIIGTNAPQMRISNTSMLPVPVCETLACTTSVGGAGTAGWWGKETFSAVNALGIGGIGSSNASWPIQPFLTPEEAWSIDSKIDDGKPGGGKLLMTSCTAFTPNCAVDGAGNTSSGNCNAFAPVAVYNLQNPNKACGFMLQMR